MPPQEGWDLLPDTDYIPPYPPETITLGGRIVTFESFGDENEIDAFKDEILAASLSSEKIRGYIEEMVEYLSWPITRDGFDFDAQGKERDSREAHVDRRTWESQHLSSQEKLRADKTAFNWNQIGAILQSFSYIQQFVELPTMQDQFLDAHGSVPTILSELAASARELQQLIEPNYKDLKFNRRLALVRECRAFVKHAVRELLRAYKTDSPVTH